MRKSLKTALLLGVLLASACTSSSTRRFRGASRSITEQLVGQLEKRTDPRHVRVFVCEFTPCEPPAGASYLPSRASGHSEKELARQIKHQLMSQLAQEVVVIEGDAPVQGRPISEQAASNPYEEALSLGATAVLVGNYAVTGDRELLLMARLVDVESNQVLAAAEDTVRHVDVPHRHR